ncbi:thioredoxin domain-containing protein [Gorillibacterium timonense]|uniref:thioredoxin domain-containing protein n=1 Tax=Gorillibacterium timonense TaxID=1689269 RepID=UPI00071DD34B|nr:thioredoxin domain-containing protein [Gorillibacterium timonense]
MTTQQVPNRLAKEKSPYLLQHAHNPVNWFPWSEEAFAAAIREDKPVFLSIGYSTCHWCHVMERESFEDEEVAELLNREYIAIKVDREERPDVDQVYMAVCQAMTGQGGWPLTVLMTPDKKPFYAGTYFPKRRKYGRYGLMEILEGLAEKWREDPDSIRGTAEKAVQQLSGFEARTAPEGDGVTAEWMRTVLDRAFTMYDRSYDPIHGGFGGAPKFPASHNLSLLLRYSHEVGSAAALEMVEKTLDAMRRGGIYDHVGFGFARYSTDERWLVPHFEKMLYDNALLAMTYIEAYQLTGNESYAETAKEIFTYVLRDMTDTEGSFYSAEDADSEGVEGKFYIWTPEEVQEVLGEEDGSLYCDLFAITQEGNFEGSSIPNLIGMNLAEFAERHGLTETELHTRVEASRQKLFLHRDKRIHPHKDDKILTAWNGLMIMALAKGAKALHEPGYTEAAERAARFIRKHLIREDGRLLARYRDGEAAYPAYLDDYAFLAWGLVELFEATGKAEHLEQAAKLVEEMLRLFWDAQNGGFYFTGSDGESLFLRPKEIYDGAMPAGNSAALLVLSKLSRYLDNSEWSETAERLVTVFAKEVETYPPGHSLFLASAQVAMAPGKEIIIAGAVDDPTVRAMLAESRRRYAPGDLILFLPNGEEGDALRKLCPLVQDKGMLNGKATAYVCERFACLAPATDYETFLERLG